jgi:hypothetical protein
MAMLPFRGPWLGLGDGGVAAPDPPIGLRAELALELHEAPHLGPVDPNIGLDVGGRSGDGGQVDAEEFGAPLQRRGDRPSIGRVIRLPGPPQPIQ